MRRRRAVRWSVLAVVVLAVAPAACSSGSPPAAAGRVVVDDARFPVALTPDGDGGVLYAERLTGRVRWVTGAGRLRAAPVAQVPVSTGGQRGLLGVARDDDGRLFVAFTGTDSGRSLQVAQVAPEFRRVWDGPASSRLANGGHLLWDGIRGRLIVGIGDLQQRRLVADPTTPNGKLLLLDPDAAPTQSPEVLSAGWNNPFAFALTRTGHLWVADNVPGQRGERLARGDLAGRPTLVTRLPTNTVPSALTAIDDRTLVVCSFVEGRALRYEVGGVGAHAAPGFGDGFPCETGIAADPAGLWSAETDTIRQLTRSP